MSKNIREENFQEALDICTDENGNLNGTNMIVPIVNLRGDYKKRCHISQKMMEQILELYRQNKMYNFGDFWRMLDEENQSDNIIQFMETKPEKIASIWTNSNVNVRIQNEEKFKEKVTKIWEDNGELPENKMYELVSDVAQNNIGFSDLLDSSVDSFYNFILMYKYGMKAMQIDKKNAAKIWDIMPYDLKLSFFDEVSTMDFSESPGAEDAIKAFYVEKLKNLQPSERKNIYEQDKVKFMDALRRKYNLVPDETINEQNKDYDIENVNILLKLDSNGVINNSNCDMIIKAIPILGEEVITRTYESNSDMMAEYANQILSTICEEALHSDKKTALKMLDNIEDVFTKDYLPSFYKIYKYFDVAVNKDNKIYKKLDDTSMPSLLGFDFSPALKNAKSESLRNRIIFSDLMKISMNSNNKSFRDFLETLEDGNKIYIDVMKNGTKFEDLSPKQKQVFTDFTGVLRALYQESGAYSRAEREGRSLTLTGDVVKDAESLGKRYSADGKIEDLPDRVLKTYIGPYQELFAGITTVAQMRAYVDNKTKESNRRHREFAGKKIDLQTGDLVKGIDKFDMGILKSILQNGVRAGEFLSTDNHSDYTPLDTDFGMYVDSDEVEDKSLAGKIASTPASGYGDVYIVLKNNSNKMEYTRVNENTSSEIKAEDETSATRIADKNKPEEAKKRNDARTTGEYKNSRYEVFNSSYNNEKNNHYGIRTGVGSTDIDYIVVNRPYDQRIGYELAMNGTYIPVVDAKTEKVLFTPEQYDQIRAQMKGMSYYDADKFEVSKTAFIPAVQRKVEKLFEDGKPEDSKNVIETAEKRKAIEQAIEKAMARMGLRVEKEVTGDLSNGFVELIDTGSTGRGTNVPGSGDFDFTFKVDKSIIENKEKFAKLTEELKKELAHPSDEKSKTEYTLRGDFRYKQVRVDGLDKPVDIDITFMSKEERIKFSTDMSVRERLDNIKANNSEEYKYTVANIILAKETLKKAGLYKKCKSDGATEYGGFGGVGVENWILQNGGSFVDAMSSFLAASKQAKKAVPAWKIKDRSAEEFDKFKNIYPIFDFGQNHRPNNYEHDSFINGLSESGYKEMKKQFKKQIKKLTKERKITTLSKSFLEDAKSFIQGRRMGKIEDIQKELMQAKGSRQLEEEKEKSINDGE